MILIKLGDILFVILIIKVLWKKGKIEFWVFKMVMIWYIGIIGFFKKVGGGGYIVLNIGYRIDCDDDLIVFWFF